MPTVEQIWRQVLPAGAKLIAGEDGLFCEVNWVVSLKPTPPGFENLKGGELALVDGAVAASLAVSITDLVSSLASRKASGVCVLGAIPEIARRRAQADTMPLIQLPEGTDIPSLEDRIVRLIGDERGELYQRERALSQELMEVAVAGGGMAAIIEKLNRLSGRTILFAGPTFDPVSPENDTIVTRLKENEKRLLARLESAAGSPTVLGIRLQPDLACFLGPVVVGKERKGYLVLCAPNDLTESDRLAVRAGIMALAVEMSRRQAMEETEDRFQSEIVESLLQGDFTSAQVMQERAGRIGLDLSRPYVVLAARVSESAYSRAVTLRRASLSLPDSRCHLHGDTLVVLYPINQGSPSDDLRRTVTEAGHRLGAEFGKAVSLGVGRLYAAPAGIHHSFQEAEQALVMGTRLFGPGSITFFGDLGVYRLLFSVNAGELRAFYQEHLGALSDYDQKHSGDLTTTLEALVKCNTITETAEALHVHRNTLLYRLRRIQEISGLDLNKGETRLILYLALRSGEIIRGS